MPLLDFYKKIQVVQEFDIVKETIEIMNENSETILNLVRGQMGSKGTTGIGKPISAKYGAFYEESTIKQKERYGYSIGKNVEFVNMFFSGDFYASLEFVTEGETFRVISSVPYFNKINDTWNDDKLVELDDETLFYLRNEIILPQLQERFNTRFNGL